ncbi:MAG: NfeD family protein [Verrucomicrobiota bacterium]
MELRYLMRGMMRWMVYGVVALSMAHGEAGKLVYVIPVRDDIEASMSFLVKRGVKEALQMKADVLILHMDTNGGRVDTTEDIIKTLGHFNKKEQTYTYIDTKALSAGAFIASATRHIYMAPTGVIGALTPIMVAPGGNGVAQMPESVEEKMTSAIRALVRANAEQNGHNTKVFDAMVDRQQGLEIDGKEIVPKGKILTLTSTEAAARYGKPPKPLLSAGTIESLDNLIEKIAGKNARIIELKPTGLEKIARFITLIAPFLMTAAFICGYIEFKTPGFGIFGILAIVCAVIFFFGHYVAGLSGYENLVIFIIGVLLIAAELLFFPGTLIMGVAGFFLALISALRSMVDQYPTEPFLPSVAQLQLPLANLGLAFVMTLLCVLLLVRILPKTPFYHQLILAKVNPTPSATEETIHLYIGQTGKTLSALRPSGTVNFGGGPVDVLTQGDFIAQNETVKILKIEGSKIVVVKA